MRTAVESAGRRGRRAGFTLLEVLIAVAALGLLAVGISQVFRATGETVRAGRRLSTINTYAALVESQLRRDFASMTRDGFLIIRNEQAQGEPVYVENGIPLYNGQPRSQWRHRRVDELMFFATGDFVTQRPPVHPSRIARSKAARIYIGHGLRWHPLDQFFARAVDVDIKMAEDGRDPPFVPRPPAHFGYRHSPTINGINEFASNWMLMRHVTLLTGRSLIEPDPIPGPIPPGLLPASRQKDSSVQVAMQPAARSVFRRFNEVLSGRSGNNNHYIRGRAQLPRFDSGVVDIATTDLTEIRAFMTAATSPNNQFRVRPGSAVRDFANYSLPQQNWPSEYTNFLVNGVNATTILKEWMANALPVNSDEPTMQSMQARIGGRMRVEPTPPNPLAYNLHDRNLGFETDPTRREIQRADQMMLSSSIFVPACSEFIVEWSFGQRYQQGSAPPHLVGELIWYGRERRVDRTGTAGRPPAGDVVVQKYQDTGPNRHLFTVYRNDGTPLQQQRVASEAMIHTETGTGRPGETPPVLYSYFGFYDPTWANQAGGNPPQSDPFAVPWPWPRLIRITMSLVDPADPTVEQTFQWIFDLPEEKRFLN